MFPLLPNDWKVGMELGVRDSGQSRGSYSPCDMTYTDSHLSAYTVENNPEFFEEIRDLDYKVLKLRSLVTNDIIVSVKDNLNEINHLTGSFNYSLDQIIENWCVKYKSWEIYSIQRVSDGEVFTIGDLIDYKNFYQNLPILKISVFEYKAYFKTSHTCKDRDTHLGGPSKAAKKIPLFTTEDDVDIFEGDNFWSVYTKGYTGSNPIWTIKEASRNKGLSLWLHDKAIKRFSTQEKAEEFLLLNKPCYLSLSDIKECLKDIHNGQFIFEKLKTLAESI